MRIFAVLYLFYGLALLCESKFKDSIEEIAESLQLSPDVAGATFMAAGTSSPELFISLASLFLPGEHDNVGAATIIGSAIFFRVWTISLSVSLCLPTAPFGMASVPWVTDASAQPNLPPMPSTWQRSIRWLGKVRMSKASLEILDTKLTSRSNWVPSKSFPMFWVTLAGGFAS